MLCLASFSIAEITKLPLLSEFLSIVQKKNDNSAPSFAVLDKRASTV